MHGYSNGRDLEPSGMLFKYIREFLDDRFSNHKITCILRTCNSSAHEIAKLGLVWDTGQSMLWPDDPPDIVKIVVARDCAELSISNIRP